MPNNFTNLKPKDMTKEDFIEVLDKYDSYFDLETGETIQAIYFHDFGRLAEELVKLFAIHNDSSRCSLEEAIKFAMEKFNADKVISKYPVGGWVGIEDILSILEAGVKCGYKFGQKSNDH